MPEEAARSRKSVQPARPTQGSRGPKDCQVRTGSGKSGASADQGVSNTCEGRSILRPTSVADLLEKLREYEQHTKIAKGFVTIKLYGDGSGFIRDSNDTELLQFDAWPEAYVWLEKTLANIKK